MAKLSKKASAFVNAAIRERRKAHPRESPAQSEAVAFSKARKHGFDVPPPPHVARAERRP